MVVPRGCLAILAFTGLSFASATGCGAARPSPAASSDVGAAKRATAPAVADGLRQPELSESLLSRLDVPGPRLLETKSLDEATCRELSSWQGDFDNCWVSPLAGGTAATLVIQTECGGDFCDSRTWLFADGSPAAIPEAPAALTLDHRWAFVEESVFDHGRFPTSRRLLRVDRRDGSRQWFADCFAPALSPGGKWIVCRNEFDDVLRLPAVGGELQLVVDVDVAREHVLWAPHWDAYPSPVSFEDGHLIYTVDLNVDVLPDALFARKDELAGPFRIEWTE